MKKRPTSAFMPVLATVLFAGPIVEAGGLQLSLREATVPLDSTTPILWLGLVIRGCAFWYAAWLSLRGQSWSDARIILLALWFFGVGGGLLQAWMLADFTRPISGAPPFSDIVISTWPYTAFAAIWTAYLYLSPNVTAQFPRQTDAL